jgi:hypothetical protein
MFSQRERSLDNLLGETRELKERIKEVLPSYTASLKELSSLPEEFERRFWASRVEALLQMVKADYENFRAKAQKVDFLGKFMTLGIDIALKAGGMEPIAPPQPTQLGISVSPSGKIAPDWVNNPYREPEAIFVTYEEFMAIAQRLKDKVLKRTVVPTTEDEIPKLVHNLALKSP